ncbi:MAG: hypothetical protein QNL94_12975 [Halioglobus sp.]
MWRAVDGEVVDIYLQAKRDGAAAKRFVAIHVAVSNLFNLGRYFIHAEHDRNLRVGAFEQWNRAIA